MGIPIVELTEDICRLMEEKKVSRAELARRMGTSRAYVTKLLDGNANFTLATMVKVAMALDGALHLHISDRRAVTRWYDEMPPEQEKVGGEREEVARTARA
jgi:transcriptional regulator with XRE-family HTH domain